MKRAQVQALKRAVSERHDRGAALALLRHSFLWKHSRLLLIRYLVTLQLEIEVEEEISRHCQRLIRGLTLGEIDHMAAMVRQMLGRRAAPPASGMQ